MREERKYTSTYSKRLDPETRSKLRLLSLAKRIPVPAVVRMAVDMMWDKEQEKDSVQLQLANMIAGTRKSGMLQELLDAAEE